ncbi:MAG: type II toxin-antitoxin system PemK/MazF family toxin [Nanoarchaeota archaeon]
MKFKKGNIVLMNFPFSDLTKMKIRPALVLKNLEGENSIFVQISSKKGNHQKYTVELNNELLKTKSYIKLDRIININKKFVLKNIGEVSLNTLFEIDLLLQKLLDWEIFSLDKIQIAIEKSWSKETAYAPEIWNSKNPCAEQCRVTSILLNEILGGKIFFADVKNSQETHFWNKIGNIEIDLTKKQFNKDVEFENIIEIDSEKAINNCQETLKKFNLLKNNFIKNFYS